MLVHEALAFDWYMRISSSSTIPYPEWLVHSALFMSDTSQEENLPTCICKREKNHLTEKVYGTSGPRYWNSSVRQC